MLDNFNKPGMDINSLYKKLFPFIDNCSLSKRDYVPCCPAFLLQAFYVFTITIIPFFTYPSNQPVVSILIFFVLLRLGWPGEGANGNDLSMGGHTTSQRRALSHVHCCFNTHSTLLSDGGMFKLRGEVRKAFVLSLNYGKSTEEE